MKRSILYLMFLATAFMSCENSDDTVFEESADARLNAAIASYQKQLVEAPHGWNAVIYPGGGGSYGFYFKFNDQNRVVMYSDFSDSSAIKSKESSYRIKALQTPALIFDTYSYLHVLADPDESVNGGVRGSGLTSDFEFSIFPDSVKTDVITLVGRKNGSRLVLTPATETQATAFGNGGLARSLLFNNIAKYPTYFKRITLGGVVYEITVSLNSRIIKLTWLDGSTPRSATTAYYFSGSGVVFSNPVVNGSQTITGFSNITWNSANTQLGLSGGGSSGIVANAAKPLSVDLAASRRWWQTPVDAGGYWSSIEGFRVNGVVDAFDVNSLTVDGNPYYYLIYQPAVNASYDLFGPTFVINNSLSLPYWYAPRTPTFTADGRVIFREYGSAGEVPASGPAFKTAELLYEPTGYYLIQTSESTYDMVSAKDARSWISWF